MKYINNIVPMEIVMDFPSRSRSLRTFALACLCLGLTFSVSAQDSLDDEEETPVTEAAPAENATPPADEAADVKEADSEEVKADNSEFASVRKLEGTHEERAEKDASATSAEATVERQSRTQQEDELRHDAVVASNESRFDDAIAKYLELKKLLSVSEGEALPLRNKEALAQLDQLISNAYFAWAQDIFMTAERDANVGKYEEAIEKCRQAMEVYPLAKEQMEAQISKFERLKNAAQFANDINIETVFSGFKDRKYQIDVLLRQGQVFYNSKQYQKARQKFDEVLVLDPYNVKAIESLRVVYQKLYQKGLERHTVLALEREAETAWSSITTITTGASEDVVDTSGPLKTDTTRNIMKKLNEIKIDKLEFGEGDDGIPLKTAIRYLQRRSKELDPDGVGVNFVLRFNNSKSGADAHTAAPTRDEDVDYEEETGEDDVADGDSAATSSGADLGEDAIVQISVDDVTLLRAIELVCGSTKSTKVLVEEHAVIIAGRDVPLAELETRVFAVEKEAFDLIGGGGEGEEGGDASTIRKYFEDRGVDFKVGGSSIKYIPGNSRLVVKNTPEQLRYIEDLINEMNIVDPQVLVQVKFVEVDMNDLQELSFEYTFSRPTPSRDDLPYDAPDAYYTTPLDPATATQGFSIWRTTQYTADGSMTYAQWRTAQEEVIAIGGTPEPLAAFFPQTEEVGKVAKGEQYIFTKPAVDDTMVYYVVPDNITSSYGKATTFGPNNELVRNATNTPSAFGDTTTNDFLAGGTHKSADGYNFDWTIRALDQADSTDTLSTPRITTMNGEEALISMVREVYYPSGWTDAEISSIGISNNNNGGGVLPGGNNNNQTLSAFTPSIPEFDEAKKLGIELAVTPRVDEDQYTINMELNPIILDFLGWSDYSYNVPLDVGNGEYKYFPNTLKMPIFEAREVLTKVMSYDGETIVLGGIIRDRISQVEDQYPILGDLPLVGRLFQSKGRNSQKISLLIFLTNRLVRPDGTPVRENEERGTIAFN